MHVSNCVQLCIKNIVIIQAKGAGEVIRTGWDYSQ